MTRIHSRNSEAKVDKVIKHCKVCGDCWEQVRMTPYGLSYSKKYILKYEDFPTFGKVKETCPSCLNMTSHKMIVSGLPVREIIKS